jgi:hypothetical protein
MKLRVPTRDTQHPLGVIPAKAGIQYAAAFRFDR